MFGPRPRRIAFGALLPLGLLVVLPSCRRHEPATDAAKDAAIPVAPASAPSSPIADAASPDAVVDASADAETKAAARPAEDGGASACRLLYGPAEQSFRGPAALVAASHELKLVTNDGGRPRISSVPITRPQAANAPGVVPPKPSSFVGVRWPPCVVADRFVYCSAPGGIVNRTTLGATDTKPVAKARPGARIAAASLGDGHAVVATLDTRQTSEGQMLHAFVTLDDGETQRLSDEGAGATTLQLVPRGDGVVAVYLDTRTAMVPVHARLLSMRNKELALGSDTVIFVGGPPERGVDFALGSSPGTGLFAFLPLPYETSDFGMAAVPVQDPPKDDVPAVWSLYPNGLDPAPIGTTMRSAGDVIWVARVRPETREPGSPRVLELGRVDKRGTFSSMGVIADGRRVTDIAMAVDSFGAVWILYGDTTVTWLERRLCPG
ncbi:hypothetical protein AKJ09_06561 [Labilithrix luteola]|uniref:Uncharacterized protein n=1 Tax=Labilithrix luteola TaxID=1391654 RepID=A0A0K1Q2D8_9BACT|nr:hypothetical protein [Labilithrix luteola]AKU99897.1 hypothetical protein AKJ09_06561 [Labilithrix luteola]